MIFYIKKDIMGLPFYTLSFVSFNEKARHGNKTYPYEIIMTVLSPYLNMLEPKLARQCFGMSVLYEHLNVRRNDVRAYLKVRLATNKSEQFKTEGNIVRCPL